jgi:PKD repeat protein/N-acetyl-anhydromuramyl-L-alanine amidase AmpD
MKKFYTLILLSLFMAINFNLKAQENYKEKLINERCKAEVLSNYQAVKTYFDEAYNQHPQIPRGILEAVSFTMTHFYNLDSTGEESCVGIPRVYGVMGLTLNGKNYFRNNLKMISGVSGISVNDIISSPEKNINAFAMAYVSIKSHLEITSMKAEDQIPILVELSEIPLTDDVQNNFALNSHLYSVLTFLNDNYYSTLCGFPQYTINLKTVFGANNFNILSAGHVIVTDNTVTNTNGQKFINTHLQSTLNPSSTDYGPAIWNAAASCNYTSGRSGTAVSAVVIHDTEGSYAGSISWFQNCSAVVSAHYVLRSSDGQITQMVLEADKAWHVGSENPYTIGLEHEGYVAQASYYTTAMYTSSAALVRDICNSGYGISPLRTGFWPWLATTYYNVSSIPGACTKIKGHQHYPNQTHDDPGQYWDWDYYYKLINNNPTITTLTTATGTLYDSGGASANYSDDERSVWVISPAGATTVTLNFSAFSTENTWDYMYIYDGNSVNSALIGYYTGTTSPGTITSTGGSITVEFRSDCLTNSTGWAATWTSTQPAPTDVTAPTTTISVPGTWQTQNFTATFTDADNSGGSGLEKSFYQVLDYNGTEWHANAQNGFFADNFDSYNSSVWTVPASSGTWNVTGGNLVQTDTSVNNSNIYASLNQNLSNRYIYQFYAKIDAATYSTSQHRFGFHFFSDNGALTNRGNSYFIFFRQETSKLEIYKVVSDVFTLEKTVDNVTTTFGQWDDYKIIFDRTTGKIDVYRDDIFLGTWTDTSVLTNSGDYISFRTGNCKASISELKVYRSRNATASISVGAASTNDIRYQNPNPATVAAKIKSIVNDVAGNLSTITSKDLNIDWSAPSCVTVSDGTGADKDTTNSLTTLSANWGASSDANSGIAKYWYAIGTTAGATNVVAWTDNLLNTSVTKTGLSLTPGQTYYFSIKSVNGAGLNSICNSDGITVNSAAVAGFTMNIATICEGQSVQFTNTSLNATSYQWTFTGGTPSSSTQTNPLVTYATGGSYNVQLIANGPGGSNTTTQQVIVNYLPVANFSSVDTTIALPNALALFANNSTHASSYLWNFGDGHTSTDLNPWNIYSAAGDYTVTLIAYSTLCANDTLVLTNYIHVDLGTGISENENELNVSVQPNPFSGNATLYFSQNTEQKIRITLTDMLGKEILIANLIYSSGKHSIAINTDELQLSKGIYSLKLSTENNSSTIMLIKY